MKIRKSNILTGRYRYRHAWWTNKIVLQVEYVVDRMVEHLSPTSAGSTYKMEVWKTKWRDAVLEDLDMGGKK